MLLLSQVLDQTGEQNVSRLPVGERVGKSFGSARTPDTDRGGCGGEPNLNWQLEHK